MKLQNKFFKLVTATIILTLLITISCTKEESILVDGFSSKQEKASVVNYDSDFIEGQYIIELNSNFRLKNALPQNLKYAEKMSIYKSELTKSFSAIDLREENIINTYAHAIQGFAAKLTPAQVEALQNDTRVINIEQDQLLGLSPINIFAKPPGTPGGGGSASQTTPWGITRVGGGSYSGSASAWIIDTGIDLDHPDLNVDVANSVSFLTGNPQNLSPEDKNGHGTHVAGTVAAIDNTEGVIGVAPGASVVAVRVLDRQGSGTISGVINGVDYVAANAQNGDVANMSLGGGVSSALDSAVLSCAQSGVKMALAAGNESMHADNSSPARVNHSNIYTVSAMDSSDYWAYFSNYGNPPVDYCAPGVAVESTWKGGDYNTISGTSMAAPHVCGLLLLGNITSDGTVNGDPDGNPDNIAHN